MTQNQDGRPPQRLDLVVVFGLGAIELYQAGVRDSALLNSKGLVRELSFDHLEELNAYVQGVEDSLGFMDVYWDDQAPAP